MADAKQPDNYAGPLNPVAQDGRVEVRDPPEAAMHMTAEEADLSGIRLLDAADRARRRNGKPAKP